MASFEAVKLAATVIGSLTRPGNSFNEHMLNKNAASEISTKLALLGRQARIACAAQYGGRHFHRDVPVAT
jgi:hypothetical protein